MRTTVSHYCEIIKNTRFIDFSQSFLLEGPFVFPVSRESEAWPVWSLNRIEKE